MLEVHNEQLRNMKERWNLLQTLRKEKRNQRMIGSAKSPEGESVVMPTEHAHGIKRKKKSKNSVFRGYIPQHPRNATFELEPVTPSAAVVQNVANPESQDGSQASNTKQD